MPLDEATLRFGFLLQRDMRRLAERREEHAARGEAMTFDSASRIATVETRRGETVARLHGEVLATYAPRDRILRWRWAGRAPSAPVTHADVVFQEGEARGVPQLTMSVVGDLERGEATMLFHLAALLAHAHGVHERDLGAEVELIGLFERPSPTEGESPSGSRFSVPPPPPVERPFAAPAPGPPPRAYRSIPPVREIFEPRTRSSRPPERPAGGFTSWSNLGEAGVSSTASSPRAPSSPAPPRAASSPAPPRVASAPPPRRLREPSRALFLPVANAALAALVRACEGYVQALFVITLDGESRKDDTRRFTVQLVVIDPAGILRAVDPPSEVIEAAASMVEADRREGNGTWRKLSARITPKPDGGATLRVDVL